MEIALLYVAHALFLIAFIRCFAPTIFAYRGYDAIAAVVFTITPLILFITTPGFDGLEYEDAYIHPAAAKHQIFSDYPTSGFYTNLCVAGSLEACVAHVTYGTHLIGFSTLLALLYRLSGEMPFLANLVSCVASVLTLHIVWQLARSRFSFGVSLAVITLLLTAPAYYLIGGSAFAEPIFALYLVCFAFFSLDLFGIPKCNITVNKWLLLVSSGVLLVSTKKEGVLAVAVILLISLVSRISRKIFQRTVSTPPIAFDILCVCLLLFAAFGVNLGEAVSRHSHDVKAAAFDPRFIAQLAPVMLREMVDVKDFGGVWLASAILLPGALSLRDRYSLAALLLVSAYLLLYSSHARHAAFVSGADVAPVEMARYLFSISFLAVFFCGAALHAIAQRIRSRLLAIRRVPISAAAIALLAIGNSGSHVIAQRREAAAIEAELRLSAMSLADRPVGRSVVIVTPFSVAVYSRASSNQIVIDSAAMDELAVVGYLDSLVKNGAGIVKESRK